MNAESQRYSAFAAGAAPWPWLLRATLHAMEAAVLVVKRGGAVVYRDGRSSWLASGTHVDEVFRDVRVPGSFRGWRQEAEHITDAGETARFDVVFGSPQERRQTYTVTLSPLPASEGSDAAAVILIQSARNEAANGGFAGDDTHLAMLTRLASVGKLAARIAHELNNPLDGILRYINLSLRLLENSPPSRLKSYLSESRTGLMRMVQIIGELLEHSRSTDEELDASSVEEVIEQAINSAAAIAEVRGVAVSVDLPRRPMPVVSGSRLYQVCCNLIKNAMDAMPDGGRLSIAAAIADNDLIVSVTDTGVGLPDPPERVFEPFFTTKAPGKGTGLGLAICKDLVEDAGGSIRAEEAEGGGTVFTVRLPLSGCGAPGGSRSRTPLILEHPVSPSDGRDVSGGRVI